MSREGKGLLERRLTVSMVIVQVLTIVAVFVLAIIPFVAPRMMEGLGSEPALDPRPLSEMAHAIIRAPDGGLALGDSGRIAAIRRDNPQIWFYAKDDAGHVLTVGEVPPGFQAVEQQIDSVAAMEIHPKPGERYGSLLLRTEQTAIGPLRVMSGGGPSIGWAAWVPALALSVALAIVLVMSIVSWAVLPRLIRRELSGIEAAAQQAESIDISRRGARLPTAKVPAEVRSLVTAVNGALSRLDQAYERRERFLADSAHELRTPIAVIQTRLQTAAPFAEKHELLLDVGRLASLAGQLLDLQRLDLGRDAFAAVDLVELTSEVTANLAPLAINNGYSLSLSAPSWPVWAMGDSRSLDRALTNIVQNAISYGGNSGVILIKVSQDGTISVADNGPGIPPGEREAIFEPFYRLRPTSHGAGLGLNLAEEIMQKHQGSISVSDAPGGGANFVIRLPTISLPHHGPLTAADG